MKIFAMDTSTTFLSLACNDGDFEYELHEDAGITHSEILAARVSDILHRCAWDIGDIDMITFGTGPGSFTGLRVGAAFIKGLSLCHEIPVVGVPTLDAIAMRAHEPAKLIVPVLDAHKEKIYTSVYSGGQGREPRVQKTGHMLCRVQDIKEYLSGEILFFGNGLEKYGTFLSSIEGASLDKDIDWYPRASDIAHIGKRFMDKWKVPAEDLEPLYLHPKECNITGKT